MSRQYLNAAKIINAVLSGGSLKKYCSQRKVGKEEYALACETLKYNEVIDRILLDCGTDAQTLEVNEFVLKIMLYELFFGKKRKIQGGGGVKRVIMSNFHLFEAALNEVMKKEGKTSYVQLQPDIIIQSSNLPKYVRINAIKMDREVGFLQIRDKFPQAYLDLDIPSLVTIPIPYNGITDMIDVTNGQMIIQDKASCFPSQILFDEWSENGMKGDFIDACAAPGNKTSHLSALSWDSRSQSFQTTIFAFDRNLSRSELLQSRMLQASATNVNVLCENFLEVNINLDKYRTVTSILVDPSCSGSGVLRSLDRLVDGSQIQSSSSSSSTLDSVDREHSDENDRLLNLSKFQFTIVSKAFQFPSVRRVVYSTCSIHQIENEGVVAEILKSHPDWELKCPTKLSSTWKRRGFITCGLTESQAQCLIRCHPEDGMNGFFVALFVRKQAPENMKTITPLVAPTESKIAKKKRSFHVTKDEEEEVDEVVPDLIEVSQTKRRKMTLVRWKPIHKLMCFS